MDPLEQVKKLLEGQSGPRRTMYFKVSTSSETDVWNARIWVDEDTLTGNYHHKTIIDLHCSGKFDLAVKEVIKEALQQAKKLGIIGSANA